VGAQAPWKKYLDVDVNCSGSPRARSPASPEPRSLCGPEAGACARGAACDSRQTVASAASFGWLI
jgi:hypothetical protein